MGDLELEQILYKFQGLELQNRVMDKKFSNLLEEHTKAMDTIAKLETSLAEVKEQLASFGAAPSHDNDSLNILSDLTPRQHVILQLFIEGFNYDQMAQRIGVSINTIKTQAKAIRTKWGVDNRSDLIFKARRAMSSVAENVYIEISGGLPKNWGEEYAHLSKDEDPNYVLYRPSKGRGAGHEDDEA
ncbi:response regulator transcription factor [Aeromonas veronii]|uniref:helix-turn-helix transcriptional regulator n=1 Tax=Aeromonas veronii TaxID=654 RepID=UPI001C5BD38A|nr:LuxR C-terminal-related transcriptional regulator [Aeromonas veronii]MBW3783807.1 response regulator transcription factor [Aeromonas veronii]